MERIRGLEHICGQLQVDVLLPEVLTAGKAIRLGKARNEMVRACGAYLQGVRRDGQQGSPMHRGPVGRHPQAVPHRGVHYPRQLILDRTAGLTDWHIPTYMTGNPGRLKPLRRLLQ